MVLNDILVALLALQRPLILTMLASVITTCVILQCLTPSATVKKLVAIIGCVHTVLWIVVMQSFHRFIDISVISWAFLLVMVFELWWLVGIIGEQKE